MVAFYGATLLYAMVCERTPAANPHSAAICYFGVLCYVMRFINAFHVGRWLNGALLLLYADPLDVQQHPAKYAYDKQYFCIFRPNEQARRLGQIHLSLMLLWLLLLSSRYQTVPVAAHTF